MRFLSVAERELRVIARRPWFFRARWITASAFFGLLLWLAWLYDLASNRRATVDLFETYSIFIFIYCLLVGAASTADCLSREKREGTLGLLFLSNLNSAEIVAGKIGSSSLTLLYSLLAIFPLLALPVLFGGITFSHFWCVVLALVNGLFFAMTAGFVASALCVRQFPAVALANLSEGRDPVVAQPIQRERIVEKTIIEALMSHPSLSAPGAPAKKPLP